MEQIEVGKLKVDHSEVDAATRSVEKHSKTLQILRGQAVELEKGVVKLGTGFTKMQAGQLAMLQIAGATKTQMQALAKTFEQFNAMAGKNPFDKSASGLARMKQDVKDLENVNKLMSKGYNLTKDQVIELAREHTRLTQVYTEEGKSSEALRRAIGRLTKDYVETAGVKNKLLAQADESTRKAKEEARTIKQAKAEELKAIKQAKAEELKATKELEKARKAVIAEEVRLTKQVLAEELKERSKLEKEWNKAADTHAKTLRDKMQLEATMGDAMVAQYYKNEEKKIKATEKRIAAEARAEQSRITKEVKKEENKQIQQVKSEEARIRKEAEKATRDAAKAVDYLVQAEQRLDAALDRTNAGLNERSTDQLVAYQRALKQSGLAADAAGTKFDAFKKKLDQVAAKERADELRYLSRAISVQMGDVAISLASGMNPLLVMIQQGDQIRGVLDQTGAKGKELTTAMNAAAAQIATGFKNTAFAITSFMGGALAYVGKSLLEPLKALDKLQKAKALSSINTEGMSDLRISRLQRVATLELASALGTVAKIAGGAAVAAFTAYGIALLQVSKQEEELNKAVNLTGGSLGMTAQIASDMAKEFAGVRGNIASFSEAITEAAKAGAVTQQNLEAVTSAAVLLKDEAGIAIADTIKDFSKLSEKPTDSLRELAKTTGMIAPEILQVVATLEQQGMKAEAAAIAVRAYSDAMKNSVGNLVAERGALETFFHAISAGAKSMWDSILNIGRKGSIADQLKNAQSELATRIHEGASWYQMPAAYKEEIAKLEGIVKSHQLVIDKEKEKGDVKRKNTEYSEWEIKNSTALQKSLTKEQQFAIKQAELERDVAKGIISQAKAAEALVGWKKIILGDDKKSDAEKEAARLLKSYGKELEKAKDAALGATAAQEQYTDSQRKMLDLIDNPDFYKYSKEQQVVLLNYYAQGHAVEELARKRKEEADAIKYLMDVSAAYTKQQEESYKTVFDLYKKNDESIKEQNAEIAFQESLLGKTAEQADKLTEAHERAKKELAIQKQYEQDILAIKTAAWNLAGQNEANIDYDRMNAEIAALNKNRANQIDNLNKESAIKAAKAYFDEFNRISASISDFILIALTEGISKGWKSIRNFLQAELKKPLTVAINAVVNSLVSNPMKKAVGSFATGVAGSAVGSDGNVLSSGMLLGAGGLAGSLTAGAGWLTGATTLGGSLGAATSLMGTGTLAGVTSGLGMVAGALGPIALGIAALPKLFGRSVRDTGISGTFSSSGFSGQQYTDYKGGIFRSDKTTQSALTDELQAVLTGAFTIGKTSISKMAKDLGLEAKGIEEFTKEIKISFKGLTEDQIQQKIAEEITGVNDALAELVLGAGATAEELNSLYTQVMQERYGLETRLLELQGNTVEIRKREREALHESNRALYDQIKAMEDQAAAIEDTTAAVEAAKAAQVETARVLKETASNLRSSLQSLLDYGNGLKDSLRNAFGTLRTEISNTENSIDSIKQGIVEFGNTLKTKLADKISLLSEIQSIASARLSEASAKVSEASGNIVSAYAQLVSAQKDAENNLNSLGSALYSFGKSLEEVKASAEENLTQVQKEIQETTKSLAENVSSAANALDSYSKSLSDEKKAAEERVNAARRTLEEIQNATKNALDSTAQDILNFLDEISSSDLSASASSNQLLASKKIFDEVLNKASSGDKDAAARLTDVAGVLLQSSKENSSTFQDFLKDSAYVRTSLAGFASSGAVSNAADNSDLLKAQEELTKAEEELNESISKINTFSSGVNGLGFEQFVNTQDELSRLISDFRISQESVSTYEITSREKLNTALEAVGKATSDLNTFLNSTSGLGLDSFAADTGLSIDNLPSAIAEFSKAETTFKNLNTAVDDAKGVIESLGIKLDESFNVSSWETTFTNLKDAFNEATIGESAAKAVVDTLNNSAVAGAIASASQSAAQSIYDELFAGNSTSALGLLVSDIQTLQTEIENYETLTSGIDTEKTSSAVTNFSELNQALADIASKESTLASLNTYLSELTGTMTTLGITEDTTFNLANFKTGVSDLVTEFNAYNLAVADVDFSPLKNLSTLTELVKQVLTSKTEYDAAQDKQGVLSFIDKNFSGTSLAQRVQGYDTLIDTMGYSSTEANNLINEVYSGAISQGDFSNLMTQKTINDFYQEYLGRNAEEGTGLDYWFSQFSGGVSMTDIENLIKNSPEALGIDGSHASGLYRVPFDGYVAELHKDEQVLTATEARSYRNSSSNEDNHELLVQIRDILVANSKDNQAGTAAIAGLNSKVYKILDKWDADGQPAVRVD